MAILYSTYMQYVTYPMCCKNDRGFSSLSCFLQAWIITCIFFVFGALFEYSAILLRLKIYSLQKGACNIIISSAAAAATGINPATTAQAKVSQSFDLACFLSIYRGADRAFWFFPCYTRGRWHYWVGLTSYVGVGVKTFRGLAAI